MEDGIENYRSTLLYTDEKDDFKKNIYVYFPVNNREKIIIFHDKAKAIDYSKEKKCKIQFFEKEIKGFYRPLNEYVINGIIYYTEPNND
jgi:hypothetical protein